MDTEKQKTYTKWSLGLAMVLGSIFLLYLNILVPYLPGDDHIFQLKIPSDGIIGNQRIGGLSDLLDSQINFYKNYHYRVLNHTVLQVLLLLPTWIFDILNVVVYMMLPFCVLPRRDRFVDYTAKYVFLLFFVWVFHFDLGRCYFLTTGSLNYTWLLIPQLLHIGLLLRYLKNKDYRSSWLIVLALANFNSNENVQIVLFVLSLYTLYKTGDRRVLLSAIILLAGGLFMLASPSVGSRLAEQGFRAGGIVAHLLEYAKRAVFFSLQFWPIILLALLSVKKIGQRRKELTLFLLGGVALSMAVMIGVPLFEPRSAIFGFFLALMWLSYYTEQLALPRFLFAAMLLLGALLAITRLPDFQAQKARHNLNEVKLTSTEKNIFLQPYCDQVQRSYLLCYPLSADPNFVDNRSLAAVYAKESVQQEVKKSPSYKISDFKSIDELNILYVQQGETLGLLMKGSFNYDNYIIIRGSRKGLNTHRIIDFIPEKWRLFFLDYLEDVTSSEQRILVVDGKRYPYLEIDNYLEYKYVLISAYNTNLHNRVGEIKRLDLSELQ